MSNKTSQQRPPIVVVLGHVDHGKTSLLDAVRNTSVQSGESGGITQNIYISDILWKEKRVTFVDTPGHEVFSLMRVNGGKVADIALLIVAADESIKPQTLESFQIIQQQGVKFIVVLTKIDKPEANTQKVINDLVANGIYLEGYGGDIPFVEVSAHTKEGLDKLLDLVFLLTEVENLLDPENEKLKLMEQYRDAAEAITSYGVVLDSSVDKALGKTIFAVLKYGTLAKGDSLYIGEQKEKAGMLFDSLKKPIKEVVAGQAFIMTGLQELPASGIDIVKTADGAAFEKELKKNQHKDLVDEHSSEEDLLDSIFNDGHEFVVPVIIRTDVKASLQSILPTFEKFNNERLAVKVVSSGVGGITTNDVDMALTFKAVLLGFRVKAPNNVQDYARQNHLEFKTFDVVYHLYDYLSEHISNVMGQGGDKMTQIGTLRVKQVFTLSDGTVVAGGVVTDGEIRKSGICRVMREGVLVGEYGITSLRVLKDERNEVKKGSECGLNLGKGADVKEGDTIEVVAKTR
ncbi:MAG: GTP-binding protein [Candidatus Dojkabacteria bacterium]|nr:MAG: GTP-binding protein [Candidatus Dojkabacteria bacterium]